MALRDPVVQDGDMDETLEAITDHVTTMQFGDRGVQVAELHGGHVIRDRFQRLVHVTILHHGVAQRHRSFSGLGSRARVQAPAEVWPYQAWTPQCTPKRNRPHAMPSNSGVPNGPAATSLSAASRPCL